MPIQTTEDLIQAIRSNFENFMCQFDRNRDGTIDYNELFSAVHGIGIDWCTARAMTSEVFHMLDKNHDYRLSREEVIRNCECMIRFCNSIQLCSPANGSVFCHFPRTTNLCWTPVACAQAYQVEVEFETCGRWVPKLCERTWRTYFTFDFVGAQPGRWRVTAFGNGQQKIAESDWWTFVYRV